MTYLSTAIKKARYLITRDNDHVLVIEKNDGAFVDVVLGAATPQDQQDVRYALDAVPQLPDVIATDVDGVLLELSSTPYLNWDGTNAYMVVPSSGSVRNISGEGNS